MDTVNIKNQNLPVFVQITNKLLLIFSSSLMILAPLVVFIVFCFIDFQNQRISLIPKSGSLLTLIGLFLTIKYRFLKDTKTFQGYFESIIGAGAFSESLISKEEFEKTKSIAKKESLGYWYIIFGTIINTFAV